MFKNLRKTAVVLAAGSILTVTANHSAEAGHFGDKLRSAASHFQQSAHQFNQQAQQQGGFRQAFKNKLAQHMNQPQQGQTGPVAQGNQVAQGNKFQTFFDIPIPNIPIPTFPTPTDPPAGGGGTTTPAGGGGTTTPAGGGGTTTPAGGGGTTTPAGGGGTTTPPGGMGGGGMGGGGMGDGGHHHHAGQWIPAVIGAIAQARMNSNYGGGYSTPVYSQPVYEAPVYEAPVYQAPVQAQAPVQYPAPVQYAAPAQYQAPVQTAPVQYAAPAQYQAPVYQAPVQTAPIQNVTPVQYQAPIQTAPVQYQAPVQAPVATQAPAAGALVIYAVEPLEGQPGSLLVRGDGFGTQAGQVMLDINGVRMGLQVTSWIPNALVVKMPSLQVAAGAATSFTVLRADGAATQPFNPATTAVVASR